MTLVRFMDPEQCSLEELHAALAESPCERLPIAEAPVRPELRLSYLADPAELLFVQAAARAGYQARLPPHRSMDWTHHMDLLIQREDGPARSVDVKNFKRLRRTLPCQDRYLCVELRNVCGRPGWVTADGPDLIAVRVFAGDSSKGTFVLLDRAALHAMVADLKELPVVDSRDVFDDDGAPRLRTPCARAGRCDCFVWVSMLDAIAQAAVGLWSASA